MALVTYTTRSIASYASYSLAINAAYAERQGYPFYVLSPATGHEYEPRDQRWNRVKILSEMLEMTEPTYDYVVWLDADLVITDMNYSLQDVVAAAGGADITISAERHAATGVANTGCFVVRNTQWSRAWLQRWWDEFDHTEAHDQIMFDRLYKANLPDAEKHVRIMPEYVLNSIPPPSLYQMPSHPVLHLMGNPDSLRARLFKIGFQHLCAVPSAQWGDGLPAQLGLNRTRLAFETRAHLVEQLQDVREGVSALVRHHGAAAPEVLSVLSEARESLLQVGKYELSPASRQDVANLYIFLYDSARAAVEAIGYPTRGRSALGADVIVALSEAYFKDIIERGRREWKRNFDVKRGDNGNGDLVLRPPMEAMDWLNALAVFGNDAVHVLRVAADDGVTGVLSDVGMALTALRGIVARSSEGLLLEMWSGWLQTMATFITEEGGENIEYRQHASVLLLEAVRVLKSDENYPDVKVNPYHLIGALEGLALHLCANHRETTKTSYYVFSEVIALQDKLLFAEQQMKEDHLRLARTLIEGSECVGKGSDVGLSWATRADGILQQHPDAAEALRIRKDMHLDNILQNFRDGMLAKGVGDKKRKDKKKARAKKVYRRRRSRGEVEL